MMSLRPSQDPDGMYEMDEMEELLKEEGEEFDKDSGSDDSEDVIFQQPSHHLSFKQKRYLQSLPAGSLVGQIAHRLEKGGTPLPFYLFWPWPKIRATLTALVWLGWLAVIVAAFWPVVQMYLFPKYYCHEKVESEAWWFEGPLLKVDFPPNSSFSLLKENFNLIEEIDVKIIHLSSPLWLMNIHKNAKFFTGELNEPELTLLKEICSFCHSHKRKVVLSINVTEVIQQQLLDIKEKSGIQETHAFYPLFSDLLVSKVDGFYIEDSESLNLRWQNELFKSFAELKIHNEQDILFALDASLTPNSSHSLASMTSVELYASHISTASELDHWMEKLFSSMPHRTILWKLPQKEISDMNQINCNLNFLGLVLPGIPVLEIRHLEQLREENSSKSLLRVLLLIRKNAVALHQRNFTKLKDKSYLDQNVYAILRSHQEERRYLVLWNLSNSTLPSLDFHMLSILGQWAFRSSETSDSSSFKMKNIRNLHSYELAIIELP